MFKGTAETNTTNSSCGAGGTLSAAAGSAGKSPAQVTEHIVSSPLLGHSLIKLFSQKTAPTEDVRNSLPQAIWY